MGKIEKEKISLRQRKCKIMFFLYIFGQGGAERVICDILNYINLDKYEVYLTIGQREGNDYLPLLTRKKSIKIDYLDVPLGDDALAQKRLAQLINQTKVDIVFTEAHFTNTLAYHASKMVKYPVKLIFEEVTYWSRAEHKNIKNFLKVFLRYNLKAKKIIAVSQGVKNDLAKSYWVRRSKIRQIYNPIDIRKITNNAQKKLEDRAFQQIKDKKIITVGRLTQVKDQKTLIDAYGKLFENRKDISLVIIGRGILEKELKNYCRHKKLEKVYFLGFKENPYLYIKHADVFVLSSVFEGFGNVIAESMAIGTPVVSTNCESGPKEILAAGGGLLVDVGNSDKLAEAIEQVLDNTELRKQLIKEGKDRVKNFEINNIVKQYEEVIDEVFWG